MLIVGIAVVKMKRPMISVRDDDLSNFKFRWGGQARPCSNPGTVGCFCPSAPNRVALAASLGGVCIRRWGALPAVTERGRLCVHALILQECRWATRAAGVRDAWRPSVQVGHSSSAMAGMHALDHMHIYR